jgi:hypothetical protein
MPCLLAEHVSCDTTADGAQQASFAFSHWRRVGVVVGRIRVAGLWWELVFLLRCVGVVGGLLLVVLAGCHALLIRLILSKGVVAWLSSWLSSWCATVNAVSIFINPDRETTQILLVPCISLRVACIICAILLALNTHLEATMLRGTEAVRSCGWGKSLVLVAAVL